MHEKRKLSWHVKQRKNKEYLKRNPPPLLTNKEIRYRKTKVQLMLRKDLWEAEKWSVVDPRTDAQMPVEEYKRMLEDPEYEDEAKIREQYGIPPPPFTLFMDAQNEIRQQRAANSARTSKTVEQQEREKQQEKEKKAANIDLTNVDSEFLAFKGIAMSRKQKAAAAARQSKRKR